MPGIYDSRFRWHCKVKSIVWQCCSTFKQLNSNEMARTYNNCLSSKELLLPVKIHTILLILLSRFSFFSQHPGPSFFCLFCSLFLLCCSLMILSATLESACWCIRRVSETVLNLWSFLFVCLQIRMIQWLFFFFFLAIYYQKATHLHLFLFSCNCD